MGLIKALTYLMFAMFAMTTDSVGIIIPENHQRVSTDADGRRNLSVRDDDGHRAGGIVSGGRSPID